MEADIGALLHLMLDKTQKMLLVHASRMMNVSINLSDIIEIPVWYPLITEKSAQKYDNFSFKNYLPSSQPFLGAHSTEYTNSISLQDTAIF